MKKTKVDDRRRLARWKSTYFFKGDKKYDRPYFDVIDLATGNSLGHLVDLTLEGMKIIGRHSLEVNKTYDIRIDLPQEVKGTEEITAQTCCVWCEKDINPEFYYAGFKILSITPPFSEIVGTLISN